MFRKYRLWAFHFYSLANSSKGIEQTRDFSKKVEPKHTLKRECCIVCMALFARDRQATGKDTIIKKKQDFQLDDSDWKRM